MLKAELIDAGLNEKLKEDTADGVQYDLVVGRRSSFEVTVKYSSGESKLWHSKLQSGEFPEFDDLAHAIAEDVQHPSNGAHSTEK